MTQRKPLEIQDHDDNKKAFDLHKFDSHRLSTPLHISFDLQRPTMIMLRSVLLGCFVATIQARDENEIDFFKERVHAQRRNIVFNSRWLSDECCKCFLFVQ
jgi:hypothetical protein